MLISINAAVDALGVSRRRLMKFIRDGMPVRHDSGNRVRLDLEAARSWIELFAEPDQPKAKRLSPDDPRYRERTAAAALAFQRAAVTAGVMVPRDATLKRYESELQEFRTRLFLIPQRLSPTASRAENAHDLELGIAEALAPLCCDQISTWPVNVAAVDALLSTMTDAADEDDDDDDRPTLPIMDADDPRSVFMVAQGSKREIALS